MIRTVRYLLLMGATLLGSQNLFAAPQKLHFDVVVYGATASGVMAAVAASREGLHVALVDPGRHVGGMVASGLGYTDRGNISTIGGIPREFFERVGQHYGEPVEFSFEPHVAEQVFNTMLREAHVAIFFGDRLRETGGVTKKGAHITAITMENGSIFSAREFVDGTYEGDLMVESRVANTWGREAAAQYHESLAGVIPSQRHDHQFIVKVSPYAANGSLLPLINSGPRGELGQGDKKIPAYTFRMCVTTVKSNQAPFPKPAGYDPKEYELYARYLKVRTETPGLHPLFLNSGSWGIIMALPVKGDKYDLNSMGAISTDNIGANWAYPTATYKQREQIYQEHYKYEAGLFYFLGHDPRVPKYLQDGFNQFGLCKDEFTDNHNWPWQLYVREDHRMLGEYIVNQHDVQENITKPDSIGMGSYQIDSHNVQRAVMPDGWVQNEGDMYTLPSKPYEIPYRSIVPERSEVVNLLVPVCMSASHVAYSSIRQEPVYMILGQAAGTAAALAAHGNINVQDISIAKLQAELLASHAVLHWNK